MAKFNGRSISNGRGGYTEAYPAGGDIKVTKFDFSKTGNNWSITVKGSGFINVIHISDRGKHRCKKVRLENDEVVETILAPRRTWWDEDCPICKE